MRYFERIYAKVLKSSWEEGDSTRLRSQKSVMVGFGVCMSLGGLLWGVLCVLDSLYIPSLIPFGYTVIIAPTLLLSSYFPKKFKYFANFQLFLSLFLPFGLQWILGGFATSGGVMLWAVSALFGAVLIFGAEKSFSWFFLYLGLGVFSGSIDSSLEPLFGKVSVPEEFLFAINVTCVSCMVYAVVYYFAKSLEKDNLRLSKNIKNLRTDLEEVYEKSLNQSRLASMGEMAAGIGHEINNPLAIVKGYVERVESALRNDERSLEEINQYIKKQNIAIDRIRHIVDGLRVFARSDQKQAPEIIDLAEVLNQSIELLSEIYDKEQVQIILDIQGDNHFILGHFGKLQQIIFNILQNAKDSMESKSKKVIKIKLKKGDNIQLEIRDHGTGIPSHIIDRIWEPFYTTKQRGKGTGIGLSLVNRFVEQMDGRIKIKTKAEVGTNFIFSFPVQDVSTEEPASFDPEKTSEFLLKIPRARKLNILVVDDEEDIVTLLSDILEILDCNIDTAMNGKEAFELLKVKPYDIVFTDIAMPEMGGRELLENMEKLSLKIPPVKVVLSGGVYFGEKLDSKLYDATVKKPFEYSEISEIVRQAGSKIEKAS